MGPSTIFTGVMRQSLRLLAITVLLSVGIGELSPAAGAAPRANVPIELQGKWNAFFGSRDPVKVELDAQSATIASDRSEKLGYLAGDFALKGEIKLKVLWDLPAFQQGVDALPATAWPGAMLDKGDVEYPGFVSTSLTLSYEPAIDELVGTYWLIDIGYDKDDKKYSAKDTSVSPVQIRLSRRNRLDLSLDIQPAELTWGAKDEAQLKVGVKGSVPGPPAPVSFKFRFKTNGGEPEIVSLSTDTPPVLTLRFSAEHDGYLLKTSSGQDLAVIDPGIYSVSVEAAGDPANSYAPSREIKLTLHPEPMIKVYNPDDGKGTPLARVKDLDRVVFEQPFRIGVVLSPFQAAYPDAATVKIRSSIENLEISIPKAEGLSAGGNAYEMKGDIVRATKWTRMAGYNIKCEEKGDELIISFENTTHNLKVSADRYEAQAAQMLEVLLDYHAMFAGSVNHLPLAPSLRAEYYAKFNLLSRVIALEDLHREPIVPASIRITLAKAYLGLIQLGFSDLGQERIRPLNADTLKRYGDRDWGQTGITVSYGVEEQAFYKALGEANAMMMADTAAVLGAIGQMPYDIITSLPDMLASPVYSGYTLVSGRKLDGEWASGEEKIFAGVDVALTFIPLSVSAIKVLRPSLYERAALRLRRIAIVERLFPTTERTLLSAEKIARYNQLEKNIALRETWVAKAAQGVERRAGQGAAAQTRLAALREQLASLETSSQAAQKVKKAKAEIAELETAYRAKTNPGERTTTKYRADVKERMETITTSQAKFEREQADLVEKVGGQESEVARIEGERQKALAKIEKHKAQIAAWNAEVKSMGSFMEASNQAAIRAQRRKIARLLKLQGNAGEQVAFETVSRDGFIRHVEKGGKLPNLMQSWNEVASNLELFGKTPTDLAELLDRDPNEMVRILSGTQKADEALLEEARMAISTWAENGIPYYPTGSIGPDGIYWNPKTNNLRIVEVKTGAAQLGWNQLTDDGIERWIELMRNPNSKMYRPVLAEGMTQALRSGQLERMLIRVEGNAVVETALVRRVGRSQVEVVPISKKLH